jgi:CopG antitoxin of type II toxin-antitoxin system
MATNKKKSLLASNSIAKLVELFDTHDMGELWDQMPEADFDIDLRRRRHLVALDDDLASEVAKIARSRHVSSESLINSLLREKLAEPV